MVASVEKPRSSARRAHFTMSSPLAPGVLFGSPIPIFTRPPGESQQRYRARATGGPAAIRGGRSREALRWRKRGDEEMTTLHTADGEVAIHRLDTTSADLPRLPHTVKILIENLL